MKNKFEVFIDTDIFTEHLCEKNLNEISILQKCVQLFDECFTSVINASEVLSEYKSESKISKAKTVFDKVGILGIPFRYSVRIAEVMRVIKKKSQETLIGMH